MKAYRHFLRYSWINYRGWIVDADQPAHVQPGRHMYSPAGPCIARPDHVQPGRTMYSPAVPCLTRPEFTNQTADCIYLNNQSIEMEIQGLSCMLCTYCLHCPEVSVIMEIQIFIFFMPAVHFYINVALSFFKLTCQAPRTENFRTVNIEINALYYAESISA